VFLFVLSSLIRFSDEITGKLRYDKSLGPWFEAINCVNLFGARINKLIEQWKAATSKNIPNFQPVNEEMSFMDDICKIHYFLTHNFHDTDDIAAHFKTYEDILGKEVYEFMESLRKLEIHALIAAFTDKAGHMMVDVFKKRDGDGFKSRTVQDFMYFFCNKGFLGYYYKVINLR
jgi:hypothetical protein